MQARWQKNAVLNSVNIIALFPLRKMLDHIIIAPLFMSENRWPDLPKYNDYEELYDMLPGQENSVHQMQPKVYKLDLDREHVRGRLKSQSAMIAIGTYRICSWTSSRYIPWPGNVRSKRNSDIRSRIH
jgi:hypothetical protein